jgi:hypothetical protein
MLHSSDTPEIITTSADQIVGNALNLVYAVAAVAAIIIIIVAGISLATSGGNAEAVKKAKSSIVGAIAGLIIVLLAFTITGFILGRF